MPANQPLKRYTRRTLISARDQNAVRERVERLDTTVPSAGHGSSVQRMAGIPFDLQSDTPFGFWAELTTNHADGTYSWEQRQAPDGASPYIAPPDALAGEYDGTGAGLAREVNGNAGVAEGTLVWLELADAGDFWEFDAFASPLTGKGDIYTHDGTGDTRLPVGTDGQLLSADSGEATGLLWIDAVSPGSDTTITGDWTFNGIVIFNQPVTVNAYLAALYYLEAVDYFTTSGTGHDVDPGDVGTVIFECTAAATHTGYVGGVVGRSLKIIVSENSVGSLTLAHANAGSAAANRLILPNLANITLRPGDGITLLWSDTSIDAANPPRWRVADDWYPDADATHTGYLTAVAQTIGGDKTFLDTIIASDTGTAISIRSSGPTYVADFLSYVAGGGNSGLTIRTLVTASGVQSNQVSLDHQGLKLDAGAYYTPTTHTAGAAGTDALGNLFEGGILKTLGAGTIPTAYTDEAAQDAVGTILTDSATLDFTYNDGVPSIAADIKTASVTLAMLADLAQDQVIIRTTASTGVPQTATITAAARTVLDDTTVGAMLTTLGGQPLDADLTTIASLTATTDNFIVSVSSAWASRTPAQVRTTLALVIGTNVQAWDADLDAIAALTSAADKVPYSTGAQAWALADFKLVARTLVAQTTQALMRTTGLGHTTVGDAFSVLANPSAITFPRMNADNSVSALTPSAALDAETVQGADIASSGTTNIATATGIYVVITGTTTITAFGTASAGVVRILKFSGTLTLTHNSGSLILPGEANISTLNGDVAVMVSLGSGNWRCVSFTHLQFAPPPTGTNTGDQTITLTGDVTGTGTGSFAATIGAGKVTLAMQANMTTNRLVGRSTAGNGPPETLTIGAGLFTITGGAASVPAATQADMEAGTSTTAAVAPAYLRFDPGVAKAACIFNGTGTPAITLDIRNCASITDGGVGIWTVNLSTAFSSANYACFKSDSNPMGTCIPSSSSGIGVVSRNAAGTPTDSASISVVAFGDQA